MKNQTTQEKIKHKLEKSGGSAKYNNGVDQLEVYASPRGKFWVIYNGKISIYNDEYTALEKATKLIKQNKLV